MQKDTFSSLTVREVHFLVFHSWRCFIVTTVGKQASPQADYINPISKNVDITSGGQKIVCDWDRLREGKTQSLLAMITMGTWNMTENSLNFVSS